MTHPTSVDKAFDTSLAEIDSSNVNTSFSSTDSDTISDDLYPEYTYPALHATDEPAPTPQTQSQSTGPTLPPPQPTSPPLQNSQPIQHISTQSAYDQWSTIYDTDGNMLQSIDDLELATLLPTFLTLVLSSIPIHIQPSTLSLIDLGCGTGRTTAKMLSYCYEFLATDPSTGSSTSPAIARITGLDFSQGMLDVAVRKLSALPALPGNAGQLTWRVGQCDCFPTATDPLADPLPESEGVERESADAVVSTLVLEHVPLPAYFATLRALLRAGGYALVTNMHGEMGQVSQAGFVNEQGVKVRGTSFVYSVEEAVGEAERQGFEVLDVRERGMEAEDVQEGKVGRRGLKWVGVKVWYAVMVRKM
ncbi:S-adenosyl-L-methionine-dependent methyltransferase [Lophiostoma macrostomum CBS 122681]|uniref:S-adenosyl-L-methionine-dependent methyltransferase n=1 Tax=Lophiostoma macrostomum CBS 122681 TaxID=1314788 RepID=A0A6A6TL44_9PLEO|nr:S-adenosyl-L-methionine-dependent methyltransferase [Lophiostoma macrostomum CBS 122681]